MTPAEERDLQEMQDSAVLDRLLAGVYEITIDEIGGRNRVWVDYQMRVVNIMQADDESIGATVLRALAVARGER